MLTFAFVVLVVYLVFDTVAVLCMVGRAIRITGGTLLLGMVLEGLGIVWPVIAFYNASSHSHRGALLAVILTFVGFNLVRSIWKAGSDLYFGSGTLVFNTIANLVIALCAYVLFAAT